MQGGAVMQEGTAFYSKLNAICSTVITFLEITDASSLDLL